MPRNRVSIIDEFVLKLPPYIEQQDRGVFRREREWKYMAFAMADEIDRLRQAKILEGERRL